jgi:ABC-type Fe3+ transport system substrate-binding protein
MKSMPNVVLLVPGNPSTRTTLPRNMPPNRAIAEAGAGQNTSDVLNAFALKVLQERNFLQPYAAPEAAAYPAAYKDPKNFWVWLKE